MSQPPGHPSESVWPGRSGAYVHGTDPDEQRRLSLLNDLINRRSLTAIALKPGEKVLDVGAGLGQLTRAMARVAGVRVLGVERSADQVAEAVRQAQAAGEESLIELREGDATNLPLRAEEWSSFDTVHARFLLEHVTDPLAAVTQMVRATRPGGRIVLEDDDHDVLRMHPRPEKAWAAWQAYIRVYEHLGNDAYVGRKLVSLLHAAGARPVRNDWLWFGGCAGDEAFRALADNLAGILRGARENVLSRGLSDAHLFDGGLAELGQWKGRPDAALWYAISWAEGARPGPGCQ